MIIISSSSNSTITITIMIMTIIIRITPSGRLGRRAQGVQSVHQGSTS